MRYAQVGLAMGNWELNTTDVVLCCIALRRTGLKVEVPQWIDILGCGRALSFAGAIWKMR